MDIHRLRELACELVLSCTGLRSPFIRVKAFTKGHAMRVLVRLYCLLLNFLLDIFAKGVSDATLKSYKPAEPEQTCAHPFRERSFRSLLIWLARLVQNVRRYQRKDR